MTDASFPRRRFTKVQIEAANETDLPALLEHLGYHVRRVGRYYTTREMDSLRIKNRRTWFRYSEGAGGDAIAFLRHFCNMSFPEAVEFLLGFNGFSHIAHVPRPRPRAKPPPKLPFRPPPPNESNRRVVAYLLERSIATQVIDSFIKSGLLYEDAIHHNCVFLGRKLGETPAFAAMRSTSGRAFKGDAPGSDKAIAFRLPCDTDLDAVHVFESPIDLMSWFTLYPRPLTNAVALCGLWEGPLDMYLKENPHLRRIVLCLDNDRWGLEAAARLQGKYTVRGCTVESRPPPAGKDWNEYLQMGGMQNAVVYKNGDQVDLP